MPSEIRISQRITRVAESATLAIDAKAKALSAAGIDIIGFGAGEPDFPTPHFIVEAAARATSDPKNHHYTAATGLPELKEAIAVKTLRDSGLRYEPSQIIVTNGAKHAIFNTIVTMVDEGDEVLIPSPFWTTYPELVRLAGGVPIEIPTTHENGFKVTRASIEPYLTKHTRLFLHVSPSNPTGALYTPQETAELATFLADHDVAVMADEIYEHLTYDGNRSTSIFACSEALKETGVIVNGVAKTYAMTGWRIGWMIAPPPVTKAAANLQSQVTSNISNVSQRAALAALTADLSAVQPMIDAFDQRRRTMTSMLSSIEGVDLELPQGAFYAFPYVGDLLKKRFGNQSVTSTMELAELLLDQAKIAVVPGEAFGAPGYLRFSYALAEADLVEGIKRFTDFVTSAEG
ncbi:MAG: pyridoxal phosphate-dependent aminotransferase [Acidimicrobiales bacterium]